MTERRLSLLRHAKAGPHDWPDHERELAVRGREQCVQVAEHLRNASIPQVVLCSTATRTRQTWDLVQQHLGEAIDVSYLDELYLADVADVLAALAQVPDSVTDVLVVGHEPTMSAVAFNLAGAGSDPAALAAVRLGMPTAGLSLLATTQIWPELNRFGTRLQALLRA